MAVPVVHSTLTTDRLEVSSAVNTQTMNVGNPSNVAVGDLLVATMLFQNGGTRTVTPTAGWTAISPTPASSGDTNIRTMFTYVYPIANATALSNLPVQHTFTTAASAGRAALTVFRVTGADLVSFTDGVGGWSGSAGTASCVMPSFASTDSQSLVLLANYTNNAASSGVPISSIGTMTQFASVVSPPGATTAANSTLNVAYVQAVAGTNSAQTISYSPAATNSGGYLLALKSATPGPPTPLLIRSVQGLPNNTTIRANVRTQNTTNAKIQASLSADMSSPINGSDVAVDADGYAQVTVTGLIANTSYYWQVLLDGTPTGTVNKARTLITPGVPHSHAMLFGSCQHKGASRPSFDEMRTREFLSKTAAAYVHLGDLHYEWASYQASQIAPNDIPTIRDVYETSITAPKFNDLIRDIPLSHTYSDNDWCGSNSDSTYAARPAVIAVRRQSMSDPTLPSAEGIYRSWVIGRIRYIQTDARSYMALRSLPDNASKSMLGATQKQWLKDEMLAAKTANQAIVWFHDQEWTEPTVTPNSSNDTWGTFNTERTEISTFITQNGLKNRLLYACGNTHTLKADDGTNNNWGGFPIAVAAPFYQTANATTTPGWTNGGYPASGSPGLGSQTYYGWLEFTDTGLDTVSVTYRGIDTTSGSPIERVTMTRSLRVATPAIAVWNGTAEIPATATVWNGTSEVPVSVDIQP